MKINGVIFIGLFLLFSCSSSEARRPVSQKTATVYSEIMDQNKKLNDLENKKIKQLIALDSAKTYQPSTKGFWYAYTQKVAENTPSPQKGDVAIISYEIKALNGEIIYSEETLGIKKYAIDKEDFIPALQDGIKLMKVGETIVFVIPSYRAFGVSGDGNKIGINQSIISIVTLIDIN
ncbi:MAG: gliding motility-associated peptidyl-prolyl isomerase GldI [Polaribacter sp.]|nr:gliding motility-associated peptidyl-prolyl isomerase GldI [Polaribacter sp.]